MDKQLLTELRRYLVSERQFAVPERLEKVGTQAVVEN